MSQTALDGCILATHSWCIGFFMVKRTVFSLCEDGFVFQIAEHLPVKCLSLMDC